MEDRIFYCMTVDHVADGLATHIERGLDPAEAEKRLRQHGPNELEEKAGPGFLKLLAAQFGNFLVIILIVAALVSLFLGEVIDAVAIIVIVALNAVVGVVQESKAEKALHALKKMSAPNAQVVRGGRQETIPSRDLVPGDVVVIEAGNYVPADLRLVESFNLKVEEASLTGESVPAEKSARVVLDREAPLGDRTNSAFMSTLVTYGRGKGIVTGTGMNTQIGIIAGMLQSYEDQATPLQAKLNQLAKALGLGCLAVCFIVFFYGLFRDTRLSTILSDGFMPYLTAERKDIVDLFMIAVSLAIAAVPEGLPAVVTICLALGMQKMIRRHALIRKLPAVETLGCATVICSDKTGTLTQNEMTVLEVLAGGKAYHLTGEGYSPKGEYLLGDAPMNPLSDRALALLLHGSVLCNDARLEESGEGKGDRTWRMVGDPTEGAMVVAAAKGGLWRSTEEETFPRVMEIPFDSERKRMSTVHSLEKAQERALGVDGPAVLFVKGAPDVILGLCREAVEEDRFVPLDDGRRKAAVEANHMMADRALRVLGVAMRPLGALPESCDYTVMERDLTFLGLMGMIDPARPEAIDAVRRAKEAGIKTVMVTGDHKDTAQAVAREIGLLTPGGKVLTGAELDGMSDAELTRIIEDVNVCCRVSPHHKTRIVDAFKTRDHVVAMTGDGVNDAPALKRANIGVAMGITGTDVSKQTADMVLTDDNFASIVAAVEEGRTIYSNIRKFVYFLLVCNVGEIFIVFISMLIGLPVPFRPIQLLWLNLVTDGAPALALGLEKGEPDIMSRPPRPAREPVINRDMLTGLITVPIIDTIAILLAFSMALSRHGGNLAAAQTVAFVTLCCSELLRAYTARSEYHSVFTIGFFSNRPMQWAVLSSLFLVLITVYVPFLRPFFGTVFLGLSDWIAMAPFILMAPIAAELVKMFLRRGKRP
jgi:Ca2+-transporting ATPase